MKKIIVSDCTLLKASEETSHLLFREKLSIAKATQNYGANRIELKKITNLKEDGIIYKTICESVEDTTIVIDAGTTVESIKDSYECIKTAKKSCLQIALPVSTVQMEYMYAMKAEKMSKKITELVSYASTLADEVEFVMLDASRADESFFIEAIQTAQKAGAKIITVCDGAGILLPEEYASMVEKAVKATSCEVFAECSNQMHMASANALSAIKAGATGVKTCISGKDILKIGSFADALITKADTLGITTDLKYTQIHRDIDSIKKIHHDETAEEKSNDPTADVFIDANSNITHVIEAVEKLGYDLSENDYSKVYDEAMKVCSSKDYIGSKELEAIVASTANQAPSTYHLESYITTSGNTTNSLSQVVLRYSDDTLTGVANGDGPIDASFKAIEQCVGHHYELDQFQIEAVTEGKEALGSAVIRLRSNTGKLYSGNGISTDIIAACIRAYVNALNKLVYEEK